MNQDSKNYINLTLSALAAGMMTGTAVAATTHDRWSITVAAVGGIATAIVQHLRQLPRKEWTDEERTMKTQPEVK